jgi:hypothetical protein
LTASNRTYELLKKPAIEMRSALFCDMTQRRVVIAHRRFVTTYQPQSLRVKEWMKNSSWNAWPFNLDPLYLMLRLRVRGAIPLLSHTFLWFCNSTRFSLHIWLITSWAHRQSTVYRPCIYFLPAALWPWGRLSFWYKWVPGIFPGGKAGRYVGLTNWPPSYAYCLHIWEPQPPGNLRACPGL